MKIFCKNHTVNIAKLISLLVIFINSFKNLIWTTLNVIVLIFRTICTLRFQIFK